MKIVGNQVNVKVDDLARFVEDNLKYSPNKSDYLQAAKIIKDSSEKVAIKKAVKKLGEMAKELGKNVLFSGLSQIAIDVIKSNL